MVESYLTNEFSFEELKKKIENQVHQPMVDVSVEYVQELEDENLKLRIENAFLKETRRLRLEDEAKMRDL